MRSLHTSWPRPLRKKLVVHCNKQNCRHRRLQLTAARHAGTLAKGQGYLARLRGARTPVWPRPSGARAPPEYAGQGMRTCTAAVERRVHYLIELRGACAPAEPQSCGARTT